MDALSGPTVMVSCRRRNAVREGGDGKHNLKDAHYLKSGRVTNHWIEITAGPTLPMSEKETKQG